MTFENNPLAKIRNALENLSQDPWQAFWKKPPLSFFTPITSRQKNIGFFLKYFSKDKKIFEDDDLKETTQRFKEIFGSTLPTPSEFAFLSMANNQHQISVWLDNDQPENIRKTLNQIKLLTEKITAKNSLLEKPDEFSKALIYDLALINKKPQENGEFLLFNLRRQISQALLGKLSDYDLVKTIEKNPHLYPLILGLEKTYLNHFVLSLKASDDQIKNENAQELAEKEGQHFNLEIDDPEVNHILHTLKKIKNKEEAENILREKTPKNLIKLGLCYYLNLWSKTWLNDFEYVLSFPRQLRYLVGARLPLEQNQLIIPGIFLSKRTIADLVQNKETVHFIIHHLPHFKIPLTSRVERGGLFFFLGDQPIGHFSSESFSSS